MIKEFLKPASATEAVEIHKKITGSFYYGGGTWLNYPERPSMDVYAVSLENLGLDKIKIEEPFVIIGASVTIQSLIDSNLVPSALKEASKFIYSRNVRNIATIGGNIGAGETDSALIPCLIALSANVVTQDSGTVFLQDYISKEMKSLILSISVPISSGVCAVRKISKTASSCAIVSAAVCIEGSSSAVKDAVIVIGGIGPKILRLSNIEDGLKSGNLKNDKDIEKAVSDSVAPKSDILGSESYKKYITGVVVAACISECIGENK